MEQKISFVSGGVIAHGLDLVDLTEFSNLMSVSADCYLDRYFTSAELAAAGDGLKRLERLASRFAIKEAVLKALGTGWGGGIAYTDVEVISQQTGAPQVRLYRQLAVIAREGGIDHWIVSASHASTTVIASVIGVAKSA